MTRPTTEHVYVIGVPGSSTVKIGRSVDVQKRLKEIQRMSPVPLQVLWIHPGGHELETNLHRHFKARRSHGEWFTFDDDPLEMVRRAVAERPWDAKRLLAVPRTFRGPAQAVQLSLPDSLPSTPFSEQPVMHRLTEVLASAEADLARIPNTVERVQKIVEHREKIAKAKREALRLQRESLREMKKTRTWKEMGEFLGVSTARAHAITQGD
ncbi:GIY-YIG nuclease family protein [Streptomyces sp. 891-h]|uniref:GIY-YIG nuclease family protein n=1 Tax=Streptomyces sp. 891-h TaxID=2720714 RepID=UPI001FAA8B5E|nr:GIY-YIG nuclease family protein [Streptomyces sp. 891-h]UNZ20599.1 GIY-YIG nuclease family protein [Streptomyces sp. 891-h]